VGIADFVKFVPANESMTASFFTWDLATVESNTSCTFCQFLQKVLSLSPAHRELSSGTVAIDQLRFAEDNRSEPGRNATCMWVSSYPGKTPPEGGYVSQYKNYRHAIYQQIATSTGENVDDELFKCRRINSECIDLNPISR
jgi:hypothetical protein